MANNQCTYIFAAINRYQQKNKPVMLRVQATNEQSARALCAPQYHLYFAGRIRAKAVVYG